MSKGTENKAGVSGKYCPHAAAVALLGVDQRCLGKIRVKGDGIEGEDDKYGESYERLCPLVEGCERILENIGKTGNVYCGFSKRWIKVNSEKAPGKPGNLGLV